jgi:hypothetical protein
MRTPVGFEARALKNAFKITAPDVMNGPDFSEL